MKSMKSQASPSKTIVSVDLNIKTIEWAEDLGLDLSGMANRLLKKEIKKRSKEINNLQARADART